MKLIPFDLQIALKHPERVRRGDGRKGIRFAHFPEAATDVRVAALIDGDTCLTGYTEDGRPQEATEPYLFLTAETKLVPWELREIPVGVYYRRKGDFQASIIFGRRGDRVWICGIDTTPEDLLENYEHAPHPFAPDSEWKPCGKEVEA